MRKRYGKKMDLDKLIKIPRQKKRKGRTRHSLYVVDSEWKQFLNNCEELEVAASTLLEDFIIRFNERLKKKIPRA
jgi:predicted nucleotidyltransferase